MTKKEQQLAELKISLNSKKVKPQDLFHYECLSVIRGTYYDRYKQQ